MNATSLLERNRNYISRRKEMLTDHYREILLGNVMYWCPPWGLARPRLAIELSTPVD